MYSEMATIKQTAARCKEERLGVTEWQLRRWVQTGRLRHLTSGNRCLIYWPVLLKLLEEGDHATEVIMIPGNQKLAKGG